MLRAPFIAGLVMALLTACESLHESPDYERHTMSRLVVSEDSDVIVFEASISPTYPENSPAAEEQRMQWLESWLLVRKLCPQGYEVLERRPFKMLEDNPANHELRYEVRCTYIEPEGESEA